MTDVYHLRRQERRSAQQRPVRSLRMVKRFGAAVLGLLLLIVGAALLVLPGPGIPVIFVGLTVLAAEFMWARRWQHPRPAR